MDFQFYLWFPLKKKKNSPRKLSARLGGTDAELVYENIKDLQDTLVAGKVAC